MRSAEGILSDSEAVTRGIRVAVRSRYVPERSRPLMNEFFFAYTIRISNEGGERVQLLSRAWLIEDAEGRIEEVRGPGVVGEQPVLAPGEAFEYTSACPLGTPFGSMRGSYQMVTEGGERFDAQIARFQLAEPHSIH
ncbi:MAG TPA: Co2+/Mg2+ efflux protein ApaG [Myxococcota bacterium]|nr:Co2+/Mg2+ efflux protein ApaG [Myxococcota bacterium]